MIGIGKLDVEIQFYSNSIYQRASSNTRNRNVKEERSTIKRSKAVDMIRSITCDQENFVVFTVFSLRGVPPCGGCL